MDDAQERKPGFFERAVERVSQFIEDDRKKIGGMTLGASMRLGLAELREAVSLGGNVAQATPYGMYGTLTPGEVAAERRDDPAVQQMEQEPVQERLPSPSEIANEQSNPHRPGQDHGHQRGRGM